MHRTTLTAENASCGLPDAQPDVSLGTTPSFGTQTAYDTSDQHLGQSTDASRSTDRASLLAGQYVIDLCSDVPDSNAVVIATQVDQSRLLDSFSKTMLNANGCSTNTASLLLTGQHVIDLCQNASDSSAIATAIQAAQPRPSDCFNKNVPDAHIRSTLSFDKHILVL